MIEAVDTYLKKLKNWKTELTTLRQLILDCGLEETFKWKHPCYTDAGKNIVIIHEFKEYCGMSFFKGALLKDPAGILIQPTENVQAARQIRFTDLSQIIELQATLKDYINEAIAIERAGKTIQKKKTSDFPLPEELTLKFNEDPAFKKAFYNLTPGRQKGYLLHFAQPKQSQTRTSRIVKNRERILDGFGFNDCTCGLSKRKPNCDGSHKELLNSN